MKLFLGLFSFLSVTIPFQTFAYQFSECNQTNYTELKAHLANLVEIYPESVQEKILAEPAEDFVAPELSYDPVEVKGRFLYRGDQRIQGIFVNYFLHKREASLPLFEQDVAMMKAEGIIGVALEVPWYEYEGNDNDFTPPVYIEKALEILEEQNMYATLLLSPHYTPSWVFEKHGDVYIYTAEGEKIVWNNIEEPVPEVGAYLTFSPFAEEAVAEQIEFQVQATRHYETKKPVVAIFLSNEQAYPKDLTEDYSTHAEQAWQEFLQDNNLEQISLPKQKSDPNYRIFEQFLQQGLSSFHNQVISAVQRKQRTKVPVADRSLMYETMSDFADQFHHKVTSTQVNSKVLVNDIYGFTPNVFALQYGFAKPIIIAETTILGPCSAEQMSDYLLFHYLNGASIITVFKWEQREDDYALLNLDGTLKAKGRGVVDAAKRISQLKVEYPESQNYLLLDQDKVLDYAHSGKRFNNVDSYVEDFWQAGFMPRLHFSDEFLPEFYHSDTKPLDIGEGAIFLMSVLPVEQVEALKKRYGEDTIFSLVQQSGVTWCRDVGKCGKTVASRRGVLGKDSGEESLEPRETEKSKDEKTVRQIEAVDQDDSLEPEKALEVVEAFPKGWTFWLTLGSTIILLSVIAWGYFTKNR